MKKPLILLNWPYYRKDWVQPFIELRDELEFVFVSYVDSSKREEDFPFKQLFWDEFQSARELLEKEKPCKVVFMSIYSGYSIALNLAASQKNIPTYVLQHGLYHNYSFYRKMEVSNKKNGVAVRNEAHKANRFGTFIFIFKSLANRQKKYLPLIALYLFLVNKKGVNWASKYLRPCFILADQYLCYTRFNGRIYQEREGVLKDRIAEIGNPTYDSFFEFDRKKIEKKYYLLIDQPFTENQFNNFGISENEMNNFYLKLNEFCESVNAKLIIKLHPESYTGTFMVKNKNITYVKKADIESLVFNSLGCFGTFSSLIIPVIYFKKCYLFKISGLESNTQEDIIRLSVVKSLDFHEFSPRDINFSNFNKRENKLGEFIKKFLYKIDGQSLMRLSQALRK